MNVKLRVLTAGVLFFTGQAVFAQENGSKDKKDKETKIEEVVVLGYSKTYKSKSNSSVTVGAETLENRLFSVLNSIQEQLRYCYQDRISRIREIQYFD
jgi:hypothetical protein